MPANADMLLLQREKQNSITRVKKKLAIDRYI
jgi:hypothetical protein